MTKAELERLAEGSLLHERMIRAMETGAHLYEITSPDSAGYLNIRLRISGGIYDGVTSFHISTDCPSVEELAVIDALRTLAGLHINEATKTFNEF